MFKAHHIAFTVSDIEQTTVWYETMLGFQKTADNYSDNKVYKAVLLSKPDCLAIELFEFSDSEPLAEHRKEIMSDITVKGTKHICFQVDDLKAALANLAAKGVEIATEPGEAFFGASYAFIQDPDGNLLEFCEIHS